LIARQKTNIFPTFRIGLRDGYSFLEVSVSLNQKVQQVGVSNAFGALILHVLRMKITAIAKVLIFLLAFSAVVSAQKEIKRIAYIPIDGVSKLDPFNEGKKSNPVLDLHTPSLIKRVDDHRLVLIKKESGKDFSKHLKDFYLLLTSYKPEGKFYPDAEVEEAWILLIEQNPFDKETGVSLFLIPKVEKKYFIIRKSEPSLYLNPKDAEVDYFNEPPYINK